MSRARQWARRTCLGASAVLLLLALTAPGSAAQEAEEPDAGDPAESEEPETGDTEAPADDSESELPDVFRGAATSMVASVQADREALLPIPEVFRFIALDGSGTYEQSKQEARASLFFPGNGLVLGPSLLCGTFGKQFPEEFKPILDTCLQYKYPLTVYADSFEPDGATAGALAMGSSKDTVSGNATGAKAHAAEDGVTTDAAMQDLRVLGLPPFGPVKPPVDGFELDGSLLTIDSAVSRTNQRIEQGGLVVDAEATISGVRMIGGLIGIGSVRSISHVLDDGKGKQTPESTLEVSGVTVAGQPAQITQNGLVVGADGGGGGPLAQSQQSAANKLLEQFNVRVTLLPAEKGTEKGAAVASVGGVLVEFSRELQDLPLAPGPMGDIDPNGVYTGSILLGSTAALGAVPVIPDDAEITDIGSEPLADVGGDVAGGSGTVGDLGGGTGGDTAPTTAGDPSLAAPGEAGEAADGAADGRTVALVDNLFADRLRLLYLAFTLAAVGLCLAPRLTLPARLPANRS